MEGNMFFKLAWSNIKKNAKLYVPSMLSGVGLVAVFYIIFTVSIDERLSEVKGGSYLPTLMILGIILVTIISVVLIFYINSFIMKQRRSEMGLYYVLGMEKRHVGRIMFIENAFNALVSLIGGQLLGIALYKLASLLICRLLRVSSVLGFDYITPASIIPTLVFFAIIYLLTIIFNRISINRMNGVELLNSKRTGEKEPKVKWILLILGLVTLGAGYYLALSVENPLQAITKFFIAVPLVIAGTYFLFVTGSIAILKLLKKNKNYYYNRKHMIAVSGLLYRMKQNAVGLASITILATSVVIMVSTTVSLYAGVDDSVARLCNHDATISANYYIENESHTLRRDELESVLNKAAKKADIQITGIVEESYLETYYKDTGDGFVSHRDEGEYADNMPVAAMTFITNDEYEKMTGGRLELDKNQVAVCDLSVLNKDIASGIVVDGISFEVKEKLKMFPISSQFSGVVSYCYGIVLPDQAAMDAVYNRQMEGNDYYSTMTNCIGVDFEKEPEDDFVLNQAIYDETREYIKEKYGELTGFRFSCTTRWGMKEDLLGMYGSFVFIGFITSFTFVFATALIIYYKQISEGYEDRERFQIMQKVGLSQAEVKKSIRHQILLIFFLPLVFAAIHVTVACPILLKLLAILFLASRSLFIGCAVGAFALFVIIYIVIYSITARQYYKIVK